MIPTEKVDVTVGGQPVTLEVYTDIRVKDLARFMDLILAMSTKGIDNKKVFALFDMLLEIGIANPPETLKDPAARMEMSATEMTAIIGKVRTILPLEKCLENLGTDTTDLLAGLAETSESS